MPKTENVQIKKDVIAAIGNTPLIRLRHASEATGCEILGKAEFLNPGQSVKDRAALFIIRDAIARGTLRPGGTIVEGKPLVNRFKTRDKIPAQTEMSLALSKELKHRGFNFCGPVIVYAFAQAVGMVNDHLVTCFRHEECIKLSKSSKKLP